MRINYEADCEWFSVRLHRFTTGLQNFANHENRFWIYTVLWAGLFYFTNCQAVIKCFKVLIRVFINIDNLKQSWIFFQINYTFTVDKYKVKVLSISNWIYHFFGSTNNRGVFLMCVSFKVCIHFRIFPNISIMHILQ